MKAHGKALERVLRSLLNQGFVEEVPVGLADEAWRSGDDGRFGLRITEVGLQAIGVPALEDGLRVGDEHQGAPGRTVHFRKLAFTLNVRAISAANGSSMARRHHQVCSTEIAQCR